MADLFSRMDRIWRVGTNSQTLDSSVSLPHIWAQTRQCSHRQRSLMSWVAAQHRDILHSTPPTHPNSPFVICLVLWAPPGFSILLFFCMELLWVFWQCLRLCAVQVRSGQAQAQPSGTEVFFCRVSTNLDLPVTNVLQLTPFWLLTRVGGVYMGCERN